MFPRAFPSHVRSYVTVLGCRSFHVNRATARFTPHFHYLHWLLDTFTLHTYLTPVCSRYTTLLLFTLLFCSYRRLRSWIRCLYVTRLRSFGLVPVVHGFCRTHVPPFPPHYHRCTFPLIHHCGYLPLFSLRIHTTPFCYHFTFCLTVAGLHFTVTVFVRVGWLLPHHHTTIFASYAVDSPLPDLFAFPLHLPRSLTRSPTARGACRAFCCIRARAPLPATLPLYGLPVHLPFLRTWFACTTTGYGFVPFAYSHAAAHLASRIFCLLTAAAVRTYYTRSDFALSYLPAAFTRHTTPACLFTFRPHCLTGLRATCWRLHTFFYRSAAHRCLTP